MDGDRVVLAEGRDVDPDTVFGVSTVGQRVQVSITYGNVDVVMDAPPGVVRHWALDLLTAVAAAEASRR